MTKTLDELQTLIGQYADSNRRSQGPDPLLWLQIGDALRELIADRGLLLYWARMALEDLEQVTSFSSRKSRDRYDKTVQALRAAIDAQRTKASE